MDQTAPPIEFLLMFCLAFMAVLALISCFSKQARTQDQQKREKFCRDEQKKLLFAIEGTPNTTVLAGIEDMVDDFASFWQGRLDGKLYRELVSELHAAAYNKRHELRGFTARTRVTITKMNSSFPFWL